ncbi:MAG: hypothetical protein C4321_09730, partial [Chloroflexota bacterium]
MRKTFGVNKHRQAAHKVGERRIGANEIPLLLELSRSEEPEERLTAATYMCPCHVRRRVEEIWAALYRLLEDPDPRVRRQAWYTLEDGGRPDDPALEAILERALASEADSSVRSMIERVAGPRQNQALA